MAYDLFQHRHNFAAWAAARATQRGFTSTENLIDALSGCGVVAFLRNPTCANTDYDKFETLHRQWCSAVCQSLQKRGIAHVTYGRAAKLVAVYLKSTVVLGLAPASPLAAVAHPPIDRILLQKLSRAGAIHSPHRQSWSKVNWTELEPEEYYELVGQLRASLQPEQPFWMLEEYWSPTRD